MRQVDRSIAGFYMKKDAEYGEKLFYEKDAELAIKHAERLFDFVKEKIGKNP